MATERNAWAKVIGAKPSQAPRPHASTATNQAKAAVPDGTRPTTVQGWSETAPKDPGIERWLTRPAVRPTPNTMTGVRANTRHHQRHCKRPEIPTRTAAATAGNARARNGRSIRNEREELAAAPSDSDTHVASAAASPAAIPTL